MPTLIMLYHQLALIAMLFAPVAMIEVQAALLSAPEQAVSQYYRAITTKDVALFHSLYPETSRSRFSPQRLMQRFSPIESVTIERWLGVEIDHDLAHVSVTVRVQGIDDPITETNFAHHDLKRINGQWMFVAVDELADAERARVTELWKRQKTRMRTEPELMAHVESIQAVRQQNAEARRQRPVQRVDD